MTPAETPTPLELELAGEERPRRSAPLDAFKLARKLFLDGERIDMQQLAAELGTHRTTLYRWVGNRDRLLGEVIWSLAEPALKETFESAKGKGGERIARAMEAYARQTLAAPFLRAFLEQEPEIALRVLTMNGSIVQARSIGFVRDVLAAEAKAGTIQPPLGLDDLAYVIVRIQESFLYTDLVTGAPPAPEKAGQAVRALLR
jgi:AcrR family transcriptional regulator